MKQRSKETNRLEGSGCPGQNKPTTARTPVRVGQRTLQEVPNFCELLSRYAHVVEPVPERRARGATGTRANILQDTVDMDSEVLKPTGASRHLCGSLGIHELRERIENSGGCVKHSVVPLIGEPQ